jgi:hypothetical protein
MKKVVTEMERAYNEGVIRGEFFANSLGGFTIWVIPITTKESR